MVEDLLLLLKKACAGDETASNTLLTYFKEKTFSVEEQESIHLYLKQAEKQSVHAIYLRGLLYKNGYGIKQDFDMSFLLLREAAGKGHANATYEVGHCFLEGIGVEQNDDDAIKWLTLAAGSPHYVAEAMYELGMIYENGRGVSKDYQKAKAWYEKASKKGHVKAKEKLSSFQTISK